MIVWLIKQNFSHANRYSFVVNSDVYQEIRFDTEDSRESSDGYTHSFFEYLRRSENLLDDNSSVSTDGGAMVYVEVSNKKLNKGLLEKRIFGNDSYELRWATDNRGMTNDIFVMMKNGKKLFERKMAYGASGPIIDSRIVDGRPVFTLRITSDNISASESETLRARNDIYYDGKFIEKEYNVVNPRYLFSYNGKLGFIAQDADGDRVFFDGKFISPAFDTIHTSNCCSYNEIVPTVYENGTLLIYGTRNGKYFFS